MATTTKKNRNSSRNINGIRYHTLPDFDNYGVSKNGIVINLTTQRQLSPKDFDHYSGRYNLYTRNSTKVTMNTLAIMSRVFSKRTIKNFVSAITEMSNTLNTTKG